MTDDRKQHSTREVEKLVAITMGSRREAPARSKRRGHKSLNLGGN